MRTDDLHEGDLRYSLTCNICGHVEEVTAQLPSWHLKLLTTLIRDHPEGALRLIRDFAFEHGWYAFPAVKEDKVEMVDLCPTCMTVARRIVVSAL